MNKWSNYGKWRHPQQWNRYMNKLDLKYKALLQHILGKGVEKEDRTGTGTISVFGKQIRHDMSEGFPLLTTKKMAFKTMVTELLWFLKGDTNIKYLVDNGCNIWNGDAYKRYVKEMSRGKHGAWFSKEEFINKIKTDNEFANEWGELGPIYGAQWRKWDGIDQISELIHNLKTNPDSRRLMVSAWNVNYLDEMTLPPCHYGFQVYTRELNEGERMNIAEKRGYKGLLYSNAKNYKSSKKIFEVITQTCDELNIPNRAISLMWNQRSVDTFLGLPFNIASYGLLLEIIAKEVNMVPDQLVGNLGDVHLYKNHMEQAKEQITRESYKLPSICLDYREGEYNKDLTEFVPDDFVLFNYQSHPTIKAPLSN